MCGLSEVDVIASFRSVLPKAGKAASTLNPSSRIDSLDMRQFSQMLLVLAARRTRRATEGLDAADCASEWVAAVAEMLVAVGFVSNSESSEHFDAQSSAVSPPPFSGGSQRRANFRSPSASYLRGVMSRNELSSPIQPHQLLSRDFKGISGYTDTASRPATRGHSPGRAEANKPMKFLWQPQLFSSSSQALPSPGPYELPIYMRRDWEAHRLRKSGSGKLSMLMGLPSSRGRTVRTFSDIPYMGHPQEVGLPTCSHSLQDVIVFRNTRRHSRPLKFRAPRRRAIQPSSLRGRRPSRTT
jgi:hypothetical protein